MDVVLDNLDRFVAGMGTTVSLTVVSWLGAFVIGVVVASFRVGPVLPLRGVGTVYVEVVRNCLLTVLFVVFFFGFPSIGILFESKFISAILVLSVYTGAFVAETVRAGVNTVAPGQVEAARSLGLGFAQVLGLVVLPQALRAVVGPLGSLFSALIRNSAIAPTSSVWWSCQERPSSSGSRPLSSWPSSPGRHWRTLPLPCPPGWWWASSSAGWRSGDDGGAGR